jgi:hypothetical protein
MPQYKEYNKMNIKPLKRENHYSVVSAPAPTFIALPIEQFITLVVSMLGAAVGVTYWITHKVTKLEGEVRTLGSTEMNNLKEKINDVDKRCRYIEQKFMDQSVYISPEVRKEIKEEKEKTNES